MAPPASAGWDLGVPRYVEVARALAELRGQGLVREVGLTNFALAETRELVDAGVPVPVPGVLQALDDLLDLEIPEDGSLWETA